MPVTKHYLHEYQHCKRRRPAAPIIRAFPFFSPVTMPLPELRFWRTPLLLQPAWVRLLVAALLGAALVALWRWAVAV